MVLCSVSAVVRNVLVMQAPDSETSVIVLWDRSTSSAVVYTVYYSRGRKRQANEMSVTVLSTESSVRIDGLESGAVYQFQVTITVIFLGEFIEGGRTVPNDMSMIMLEPITTTPSLPTTTPEPGGCMGGMLFPLLATAQSMM